jgi:hypothetical protein
VPRTLTLRTLGLVGGVVGLVMLGLAVLLAAPESPNGVPAGGIVPSPSPDASPEELERSCATRDVACDGVFSSWGLTPPRSLGWDGGYVRHGPRILITSSQLWVEDEPLLVLDAGRTAPDAFAHHVSPLLGARLEVRLRAERERPAPEMAEQETRLVVAADRATPVGTLTDVLFTATKAGVVGTDLVVHVGQGLRTLSLTPPRDWLEPDPDRRRLEPPPTVVFTVHRDTVDVRGPHGVTKTFAAAESEAIDTFVESLVHAEPVPSVATYRVDARVSLHELVGLIDAVRGGQACTSTASSVDAPPEGCRLHVSVLDAEPGLYFHVDRVGTFILGDAAMRPWHERDGDARAEAALLRTYAAARAEIQRCFEGGPELTKDVPNVARMGVMIGRAGDSRRPTARVFLEGFVERELERCVLEPLGLQPDSRAAPIDFLPTVEAELSIEARFEPLATVDGGAAASR